MTALNAHLSLCQQSRTNSVCPGIDTKMYYIDYTGELSGPAALGAVGTRAPSFVAVHHFPDLREPVVRMVRQERQEDSRRTLCQWGVFAHTL